MHVTNAIVFSLMTFPTISTTVVIPSFNLGILHWVSTCLSTIHWCNAAHYWRVIYFNCVPILLHHCDQHWTANTLNVFHTCQPVEKQENKHLLDHPQRWPKTHHTSPQHTLDYNRHCTVPKEPQLYARLCLYWQVDEDILHQLTGRWTWWD